MGFSGSGRSGPVEIEEKGKRQLLQAEDFTQNSKERRQMEKGEGIDTSVTFSASRYRRNRPVKWLMFSSFRADASVSLESVLSYFAWDIADLTSRGTGKAVIYRILPVFYINGGNIMKRKIFAAFLSLMMVVSMLPTSAFAAEVEAPAECQHENAHWETVEEATCTEPGKQVLHCHDCETDLEEKEIPALGHDLQPTGEFVDPTCTEGAGEEYACTRCDHTEKKVIEGDAAIPALGHDMKETVVPATCKEGGYTLHECTRGDYSYKDNETEANEDLHNVVLVNQLRAADCKTGTNGIGRYECSICGKNFGYKTIPADHSKVVAERVEPTCVEDGKVTYKCSVCGIDLPDEEEVLPATGKHTFVEGEFIDATCTENAKEGQKCSVCGAAGETKEIPGTALGHDEVADEEKSKEATCTEDGLEVIKCSRCGEVLEEIVIPATGHKYKSVGYKAATCQNAGGEGFECTVCGDTYVEPFTGEAAEPATGHTEEEIPAVAATCTTTGLTVGVKCSVCGEILVAQEEVPVDEDAHVPVVAKVLKDAICGKQNGIVRMECELCHVNLGYEVIDASEHEPVEVSRVEADCIHDGIVNYKCGRCGEELEPEVLPATGKHTFVDGAFIDATCTENAKEGQKCSVCGAVGENFTEIPNTALGHDEAVDQESSKDATCTEDGVEVIKCKRCEEVLEEIVIPATGHKYKSTGYKAATCKDAGGEGFECTVCGDTYVEPFTGEAAEPAIGHTEEEIPEVAATCTTTGLTAGVKCSVCGEILVAQEETPVISDAHVPVVAKVLKEAICGKQNGIVRMECQLCHENLGYEVVDASEHVPVESSRVEATCGEDGVINYKCERCGETLESEVIPATGEHTFVDEKDYIKTVAATCVDNEKLVHLCTVCGAEGEEKELEGTALGHKWVLDETAPEYKAVTCEEDGLDTFKCERCEETKTEVVKATGKHVWDNGKNVDATCTTASGALYTCTKCGETYFEEYPAGVGTPATGHTEEVIPEVPATCSTTGLSAGVKCSVCGAILLEQEETPVDKDAHVPVVAKVLKDAICGKQNGINRMECQLCHENLGYEVVDASEHKAVEVSRVEATCGKDGVINYKCERCGETLESEVIPATGEHTFVDEKDYIKTIDATCIDNEKLVHLCTVCGAEGEAEELEGTALGHKWILDKTNPEYKAVSCEEDGLDTFKCERCEETKTEVVKATGKHQWNEDKPEIVEATCTEDQHLVVECTICHKTESRELPGGEKALGHDEQKTVHAATCSDEGYTTITCSRCDYKVERTDVKPVDPENHVWKITHLKDATCTSTGIDKRVCENGDKSEYVVSEKLDHVYNDDNAVVSKEATCVDEGEISNTCTVCGKTAVVGTIPATGKHTPVEIPETDTMSAGEKCSVCGKILKEPVKKADCEHKNTELIPAVEATCTSTGLSVGLKCADCGKIIEAQTVIPKLAHTVVEIPAVEATCTATGLTAGEKCSVCGEILKAQETVAMREHTVEVIPAVEATCTATGLTAGEKCSVCGKVLKAQETVAMKEHTVEEIPAVEATCTATGLTAGEKCSVCGKVLKAQETVAMKEHTEAVIDAVAATCTEAGHKEGVKCSVCGTILLQPEDIPALGHDYEYVDDGEDDNGLWVKYVCTRCGDEKIDR